MDGSFLSDETADHHHNIWHPSSPVPGFAVRRGLNACPKTNTRSARVNLCGMVIHDHAAVQLQLRSQLASLGVQASASRVYFLTCSTRARCSLASATASSISSSTARLRDRSSSPLIGVNWATLSRRRARASRGAQLTASTPILGPHAAFSNALTGRQVLVGRPDLADAADPR